MQQLKQDSSKWINDNQLTGSRFAWQEGYGAFSYGQSQLPAVIKYIENQEEHHRTRTFLEEYRRFLDCSVSITKSNIYSNRSTKVSSLRDEWMW